MTRDHDDPYGLKDRKPGKDRQDGSEIKHWWEMAKVGRDLLREMNGHLASIVCTQPGGLVDAIEGVERSVNRQSDMVSVPLDQIHESLGFLADAINGQAAVNERIAIALETIATHIGVPDATGFNLAAFTQPTTGGTMPIDPGTLTPLVPGTPVPANSRVVFGVTNDPPGSKISSLTASSDNSPAPLVDSTDQQTNYVLCDPPSDRTLDSTIQFGDPDGSPTGTATIDWDAGTVTDATGFVLTAFTQPMSVTPPMTARARRNLS